MAAGYLQHLDKTDDKNQSIETMKQTETNLPVSAVSMKQAETEACFSFSLFTSSTAMYSSSRPCLYLAVPSRFRFRPISACLRRGGAVDAGSCQARSRSGDETRVEAALRAR